MSSYNPMITDEQLQNWFTYHAPCENQPAQYEKRRRAGLELARTIVELRRVCDHDRFAHFANRIRLRREIRGGSMSVIPTKCPNCGNDNLGHYQETRICNACGWRTDVVPAEIPAAPDPSLASLPEPSPAEATSSFLD